MHRAIMNMMPHSLGSCFCLQLTVYRPEYQLPVRSDRKTKVTRGDRYLPGTIDRVPEWGDRLRLNFSLAYRVVGSPGLDTVADKCLVCIVAVHVPSLWHVAHFVNSE